MKLTNKMLLLAILSTTLVACGKKEEPAAPATPAPAPATAPAATPAPAAPAAATPAPAADTTATAPAATDATASTGGLPAECEAYLKRAEACYAKAASANAAAVDQMRQGLDQVRTQWNAVPDKSQLGEACKMAESQFAQTVAMLKCE